MKIGAITIGQAPRVDVTCDIMDIFGDKIELLQRGGLDGLTVPVCYLAQILSAVTGSIHGRNGVGVACKGAGLFEGFGAFFLIVPGILQTITACFYCHFHGFTVIGRCRLGLCGDLQRFSQT